MKDRKFMINDEYVFTISELHREDMALEIRRGTQCYKEVINRSISFMIDETTKLEERPNYLRIQFFKGPLKCELIVSEEKLTYFDVAKMMSSSSEDDEFFIC